MKRLFYLFCIFLIPLVSQRSFSSSDIISPTDFFGFKPGSDRMLFDYDALIRYLRQLDQVSEKLQMSEIGTSPLGKTMYLALFSSPENLANIERLQTINKKLALNEDLPSPERDQMFEDGKVFVLATLSMHSGEVGPTQAAPLIAHELITSDDQEIEEWLKNVVYMMVPCHNPDGMDMIVTHYKKTKGTTNEGSSMPGVYHKYVGHDNNRDFVTLSQSDTKAIARIYNQDWFPQVLVEKHQMGWYTSRYFVPPTHDPISENIDATLWNWMTIFGSNLMTDMTREGLAGVSQHYLFDDYWPGSTETALWKNVIAMLTEAASVQYATPIYIEANELKGFGKGLSEYKKSINMPLPWPGGWWRLSDIVDYEIVSTKSILKTAASHRKAILKFRNDICKKEVAKGHSEPPYYFIIPKDQRDMSEFMNLIDLLMEHGIRVYSLKSSIFIKQRAFQKGDIVVPLAQPFRAFIKEVLEKQYFPERHYTPGGEMIKPYDITSWSLPLHRGIETIQINERSPDIETSLVSLKNPIRLHPAAQIENSPILLDVYNNESYKIVFKHLAKDKKVERLSQQYDHKGRIFTKGSFVIREPLETKEGDYSIPPTFLAETSQLKTVQQKMPRIALVETYFHDMDAGWTRFVFDSYAIPYKVIRPGEILKTDLKNFDIIIFPDSDKELLLSGKYKSKDRYYISNYPKEFTKGLTSDGLAKIAEFINSGGLVISWGRSTRLFTGTLQIKKGEKLVEEFQFPVQDISSDIEKQGLYCPGSLLRMNLKSDHPLTWGMPKSVGIFYRGRPLFSTTVPSFDMDRRVIGRFPETDILMSGYCEKEKLLGNKTILVWLKKGKGQVILFGFTPQFRASTQATYKLLFNALLVQQ